MAASRRFARAWAPIMEYLGDDGGEPAVVWMPAHTKEHHIGVLELSDGTPLSSQDFGGNREADRLAKLAVDEDSVDEALGSALQSRLN